MLGMVAGLQPVGLSHSEIRASKVICTYTRLFAAYHVLPRLSEPRHPPSALFCFPCSLLALRLRACAYFQSYFLPLWELAQKVFWNLVDCKTLQSCLCQYVK